MACRYFAVLAFLILFPPLAHGRANIRVAVQVIGPGSVKTLADSCIPRELRKLGDVDVVSFRSGQPEVMIQIIADRLRHPDDSLGDSASIVTITQLLHYRDEWRMAGAKTNDVLHYYFWGKGPMSFLSEQRVWTMYGSYRKFEDLCTKTVSNINAMLLEPIRQSCQALQRGDGTWLPTAIPPRCSS